MWSYVYNVVRVSSRDVNKEADSDGHGGSTSTVKDAGETPELIQGNYSEAFLPSKEFPVSDEYELLLPCTNSEGIVKVRFFSSLLEVSLTHVVLIHGMVPTAFAICRQGQSSLSIDSYLIL